MPWTAVGKGARRNADTTITVKAEIQKDGTRVRDHEVTAANISAVRDGFDAELQRLRDAERDVVLNDAVVGKVLASV